MLWFALLLSSVAWADEVVYGESLAPGWEDWSWSASIDPCDPTVVHDGSCAMNVRLDGWGALSLYKEFPASTRAVSLWIEGDAPDLKIALEADWAGKVSEPMLLQDLATVRAGEWTQVFFALEDLGAETWTRITLQDAQGFGTSFRLDQLELLDSVPDPSVFTSFEIIGPSRVMLLGDGNPATVNVWNEDVLLEVVGGWRSKDGPERVYLDLDLPLVPGRVAVETDVDVFIRQLAGDVITLGDDPTHKISADIYGMAFPDDAAVDTHGLSVARWGGNHTSLYNPLLRTTNAGKDWYFENRAEEDVEPWMKQMSRAGLKTFLRLPVLDVVAKDGSSYSYSQGRYGGQQACDPWNPDACNGVLWDGTEITWNDPGDAYTRWTPGDLEQWVGGLAEAPDIAAVGNELDIVAVTHPDVHPELMTYDELWGRFVDTTDVMARALPDTKVAAPSSCCWWYYWNSHAGEEDKAAHGGQDFIPWFLDHAKVLETTSGRRVLDYLDLHYYPTANIFSDEKDPETRARRLRATRGLWDPSYKDEGWIGGDGYATQTQPNKNEVQWIPRFHRLINQHYPGTKLSMTEWNWGADGDISGGLATADALGIFGREGLHLATWWGTGEAGVAAVEAFRLFRDDAHPFGDRSIPVEFGNPDMVGAYAALDDKDGLTLVVVNKDPDRDVLFSVEGLEGEVLVRHMSRATGGEVVEDPWALASGWVTVPAYGAVFLAHHKAPASGGPGLSPLRVGAAACGCDGGGGRSGGAALLLVFVAGLRRRPFRAS